MKREKSMSSIHMYENGKMRPVETTPGMGEWSKGE
jgi:hypothetical protein